ncbi:MAG: hypothetical protein KDD73_08500 [Anaerolineales bacterium]|nr:hypothetical protein [Anaerolineales bacterium]MCB9128572.1 hypothetical protein [Ardenticatenales bacterium]MCB9172942.1 hypothetical protein [Ardenticatenales bacterium]
MIVRISAEGQYRLSSALLDQVNEMDDLLVEHIADIGDEAFSEQYERMLTLIREEGEKVGDDELVESHVIMPPADISAAEARSFFTGDGLFAID